MAVLVVYSFNEAKVFEFPPANLSFKWYEELFNDRAMLQSIVNSSIVAAGVVPVTLLLGVPAAFALNRFEFPGKAVFERAVMLPLMIPGLITGLAILMVIRHSSLSLCSLNDYHRPFRGLDANRHYPGLCSAAALRSPP